jgi:hypothetical protein
MSSLGLDARTICTMPKAQAVRMPDGVTSDADGPRPAAYRKASLPDRTDSNHKRIERKGVLLITTLTQVHWVFSRR